MDSSDMPSTVTRQRLLGANGWLGVVLLVPFIWAMTTQGTHFSLYLFKMQDMPVIAGLICFLLLTDRWSPHWKLPTARPSIWHVLAGGVAMTLLLWWGCYALLGNYPLSRDENMVVFDMAVFSHGHLAEPVALAWRPFAVDLVPAFLLNPDMPRGLVSGYLPINAAFRQLFSFIADPALMNPLLLLVGGVALLDISRRLFSEDNKAIWVVLLVYVLSAQAAVNAMTTYAMTAHMALNLVWLAAFLRGGKWGHGAAIAVGFLATGLHQLVFHPLFVAPFLLWRLRQGAWRLVLLYAAAYLAITAWWMSYPGMAMLQAGVPAVGSEAHQNFFAGRVLPLLLYRDPHTFVLMMLNLLRFIAWQNLALLPLFVAAIPLAWRNQGLTRPMLLGIALLLMLVTIVLPYQGHGWGYRYLHPMLGSFALLAGYGYQRLSAVEWGRIDGMVLALSALTLIGSVPLLMDRAYVFVAPHVALERFIAAQKTDFVLVDTDDVATSDGRWEANAIDHVRNLPNLSNRPLRFSSRRLSVAKLRQLCARGSVHFVTHEEMRQVGFGLRLEPSPRFGGLVASLKDAPCVR